MKADMMNYYADLRARTEDAAIRKTMEQRERDQAHRREATINEISDAYADARDGKPAVNVTEALAVIAGYFYSPGSGSNDEGIVYNDLAFQQRGVLGNIVNNAVWTLENAHKHLTDLYTKLDQEEATFDDTEIAIRNLNCTLDQLERCKTAQIPACEDWVFTAKAAYLAVIGEEWKPFAKRGKTAAQQSGDALRARIAALRG